MMLAEDSVSRHIGGLVAVSSNSGLAAVVVRVAVLFLPDDDTTVRINQGGIKPLVIADQCPWQSLQGVYACRFRS